VNSSSYFFVSIALSSRPASSWNGIPATLYIGEHQRNKNRSRRRRETTTNMSRVNIEYIYILLDNKLNELFENIHKYVSRPLLIIFSTFQQNYSSLCIEYFSIPRTKTICLIYIYTYFYSTVLKSYYNNSFFKKERIQTPFVLSRCGRIDNLKITRSPPKIEVSVVFIPYEFSFHI